MKKFFLLCLSLLLLVTFLLSCAERPDIDETEETEEETEYVPPEKDYLTKLAENKGYQDYPDSIHCYTKPLIDPEDYCDKSELTFDTSQPEDGRFLSCSYRYQLEITSSQGGFVTENANSNYLTAPDGERIKLCPYDWCREDFEEKCTHLDLTSGKVVGDYVYFVGSNACVGSPNHPDRDEDGGYVSMLLRYSIETHEIEKVLRLPGTTWITLAAYGNLYLDVRDEALNSRYFLILDCTNMKAAKSNSPYGGLNLNAYAVTEEYIYYLGTSSRYDKQTLYRCRPNLTESEEVHVFQYGDYDLIGTYRGNFYLTREYNREDETSKPQTRSMFRAQQYTQTDILRISKSGNVSVLLTDVHCTVLTDGVIYTTDLEPRVLFQMEKARDGRTDETNLDFYTNCGTTVTAHTLSLSGDIRRSETVFDETVHSPGQALFNIQKYGNSILAVTAVPPNLSGYSYTYHKYHITDGEVTEIAEGNTNAVYP